MKINYNIQIMRNIKFKNFLAVMHKSRLSRKGGRQIEEESLYLYKYIL